MSLRVALVARRGCGAAAAAARELAAAVAAPNVIFTGLGVDPASDNGPEEHSSTVSLLGRDFASSNGLGIASGDSKGHGRLEGKDGSPDMVVAVGGDGTLLRAAEMYGSDRNKAPPLFVSVARGTLGFLMHHSLEEGAAAVRQVLAHWGSGAARSLPRDMRVHERVRMAVDIVSGGSSSPLGHGQAHAAGVALNEVVVHRGASPHVADISAAVDGVDVVRDGRMDGLILATPTGSTAYALSAGGPLLHASADALVLVPVSPRSLSFRPLVLPSTAAVDIGHGGPLPKSRVPSVLECSIDGRTIGRVPPGHAVRAQRCAHPLRVLCRSDTNADWIGHVRTLLGWGRPFGAFD